MKKYYSNKPIVILKTSFAVSSFSALCLGAFISYSKGNSFEEFIYISYLFFVNNLLMPVSIAAIIYYFIIGSAKPEKKILRRIKAVGILSIVSLLLLFTWNIIDFLFNYNYVQERNSEHMINELKEQFLIGIILAFPIALLISWTYHFMEVKKK